ncbi:hypothetical protein D3C86_1667720 [compost metagenome]
MRTDDPSGFVRSRMLANCSGVVSRLSVLTVAFSSVPRGDGVPPSSPTATWMFCSETAAVTSSGVRL